MTDPSELTFFTHVLKAGGTTVETALRRSLGLRHMAVDPPTGWIYTPHDLKVDRRLNPLARSFSSHWLRPFVDFSPHGRPIAWATMVREPVSRYRSHRQHHMERFGAAEPVEDWLAQPVQRNWQTRQIAGKEDLSAAKQILRETYRFVGVLERFDESLVLLEKRMGLPTLYLGNLRARNKSYSGRLREAIEMEFDRHEDWVRENNALDLELYRYVIEDLYPAFVAEHGADELKADVSARANVNPPGHSAIQEFAFLGFRRFVQIPFQRIRTINARRAGRPDLRY